MVEIEHRTKPKNREKKSQHVDPEPPMAIGTEHISRPTDKLSSTTR